MNSERPLTIVHTEASCGWGGQDIRVLREAEWFRSRGHTVHIVTPPEGELFRRAKAAGFEPVPMAFKKNSQLGDFFRLRRLFKRLKPDVVGTHSSVDSRAGLFAAASCGVKCRLRYRHVSTPVKSNPLTKFQYTRLATHVITTGDKISDDLVATLGLPRDRVACVSTGVESPDALVSREEARLALCRELGLPDTARFIGQVAVLRSWKGHGDLMKAFDSLAAEFPGHHLVFVGEGPFRDRIEGPRALLASGSRIHLVGHRENPWPAFRAMDVCCLCSVSGEGIPQSLMQAMLAGTPVVGTDVGGIPEVVKHGETGLVVPPASPERLADTLRETLQDPAATERRVRRAAETIARERSPSAMGAAVLAIISRNLAG